MLKRFGKRLVGTCYLLPSDCKGIDIEKYKAFFMDMVKSKKVYVVNAKCWTEQFLCDWFEKNFGMLGFSEVFKEHTLEYNQLKKEMKFYGYPDYLARTKNNQIVRVEIEVFSSNFHHGSDYCELMLCYESDVQLSKIETFELKTLLGYEEIINKSEILEYLYLRCSEFKKEIKEKISQEWTKETE